MDVLHPVLKFVDHHRYTLLLLVVMGCLSAWMVGCEPRTGSLVDQERKVTAAELNREVTWMQGQFDTQAADIEHDLQLYNAQVVNFNEQVVSAEADIARQVALRIRIVETIAGLGSLAAGGTLTPAAAVGSVTQLLLAGLVVGGGVDVVRKNRVIKRLKNGEPTAT